MFLVTLHLNNVDQGWSASPASEPAKLLRSWNILLIIMTAFLSHYETQSSPWHPGTFPWIQDSMFLKQMPVGDTLSEGRQRTFCLSSINFGLQLSFSFLLLLWCKTGVQY